MATTDENKIRILEYVENATNCNRLVEINVCITRSTLKYRWNEDNYFLLLYLFFSFKEKRIFVKFTDAFLFLTNLDNVRLHIII